MAVKTDWRVPPVEHPDLNMLDRQNQAISGDESWSPYLGLPRDWTRQAVVL